MATLSDKIVEKVVVANIVGKRAYLDKAPSQAKFPYVTVDPHVSDVATLNGNGRALARIRALQVDLWQDVEDDALYPTLEDALDGTEVIGADDFCYGVVVESTNRLYEQDTKRVHHALTLKLTYRA